MNISGNAIKYTKEGSVSLNVSCEKHEDKTCTMMHEQDLQPA